MKKKYQFIIISFLVFSCGKTPTEPESLLTDQNIIDNHQVDSQLIGTWDLLISSSMDTLWSLIFYSNNLGQWGSCDDGLCGYKWKRTIGPSSSSIGSNYYTYNNLIIYKSNGDTSGSPYYHTEKYFISNDTLYTIKVEDVTYVSNSSVPYNFDYSFPVSLDTLYWKKNN